MDTCNTLKKSYKVEVNTFINKNFKIILMIKNEKQYFEEIWKFRSFFIS